MSFRARSTSITCSARSFGSETSRSASSASSAGPSPLGAVPAIGLISTCSPVTLSSGSGEVPAIWKSPNSMKYMYGEGLIPLNAR